ncbi:diacylglycerol kinase [Chitinibacter sp. SCUT-21]|uniref:diacylglycerol kinase n=1 Tax=Chitinibacter sp. SCUT-21 TaxID=2970891 RepID=UPI0035A6900C
MNESPFKGKTGIQRVFNALGYSLDGLSAGWKNEAAFRQVLILAIVGIPVALYLSVPIWGKGLLIISHLACVIVELLNSAIEAAVDHTSLEKHHLAKRAKDLGSAAQLIGLINLTAMWALVLLA